MLYNSVELKKIYGGSSYKINKALYNKEIYKIDKGIYSDVSNVHYLDVIMKKYPDTIIAGHSAYYYHNLTDIIPKNLFLATDRNHFMIHYDNIKQIRMKNDLYELGMEKIEYEGVFIKIYNKERLLIDLVRNKKKMGYDLYKEIILNYRDIVSSLDMQKIEEYLNYFRNGDRLFEMIQDEVF